MARMQGMLPEYIRLNRMYRDIPASEILEGSKLANLRQVTDEKMRQLRLIRKDISAREIRLKENDPTKAILDVQEYEASGGKEYFLQFIDPEDRTLFSLLRLRVPSPPAPLPEGEGNRLEKPFSPKYIIDLARELRKTETSAEKLLWEMLRDRKLLGLKFRRQHPIGRYIADFFCHEIGLVIELDGAIHENMDQKEYDAIRDEFMKN